MKKRAFGKTDLTVSELGFGGAPVGLLDTEADQVRTILHELLDRGMNVIDTAACYGGSEQLIGQTVADRRDEFVLISKCGHASNADLEGDNFSPEVITKSIDRSLDRLHTDHIDVMLLHSCSLDKLKQGDAIDAVLKARDAGKVRHVGYSGDNDAAAWAAARDDIEVIETSINLADQRNIDAVLPVCVKHDVGVIAKRPIANACWKQPEQQPGMYKDYASEYHRRFALMNVTPRDLGYYGHVELEWPEIALKFTLAQRGVHTAIVGTTSPSNAQANLDAVEKNPLREQVVQRLREAFQEAQAEAGETWDGQT